MLLKMVTERIPSVRFRPGYNPGANRIELDIDEAVDKGFAVFNDAAF
jgi:hypothetical protein